MIEPVTSPRLGRARAAYEASLLPLADGYVAFRERAVGTESVSAALLATIAAQAEAIALVWEAHERGVATLPPAVAAAVSAARTVPR